MKSDGDSDTRTSDERFYVEGLTGDEYEPADAPLEVGSAPRAPKPYGESASLLDADKKKRKKPLLPKRQQEAKKSRSLNKSGLIQIPQPEFKGRGMQFVVIYFAVFVDMLGFGLIMPSLPIIAVQYGGSALEVGIMVAAYSAAQMVGSLVCGVLSDKIGRKWVLAFCLFGSAVTLTWMAFCTDLVMLIWIRAADGAMSATIGTAQACIADLTLPKERAKYMGLVGAASGVGVVAGPALGGIIQHLWGFKNVCFTGAGISLVNFLLAVVFLKESHTPERRASIEAVQEQLKASAPPRSSLLRTIVRDMNVLYVFASFFWAQVGFTAFSTVYVLYANEKFGMNSRDIGLVFAAFGTSMILTQLVLTAPFSRYLGDKWTSILGSATRAAGLWALPYMATSGASVACVMLVGISGSLIQPCLSALVACFSDKDTHGGILGFNQLTAAFGRMITPLVCGWVYDHIDKDISFTYIGGGSMVLGAIIMIPCVAPEAKDRNPTLGYGVLDDEENYEGYDSYYTDGTGSTQFSGAPEQDYDDDYTDYDYNDAHA